MLSFLILYIFAGTFGTERRPIVEFALEDVEKMRLQRIRNERNERAKEAAHDRRRTLGDQSATDGPPPNKKRPFGKGRKQESHDVPSKSPESGSSPPDVMYSADPKSMGSTQGDKRQPQRPAKRARHSKKGAVVSEGNHADAAPNAVATVSPIVSTTQMPHCDAGK
jgi:nucleolar protein 4